MSTWTLGGHVDTIDAAPRPGRRTRRLHTDEFKADAVAAACQPGVSMAAVAMARGINANLLRRWVREAEMPRPKALMASTHAPTSAAAPAAPSFVSVPMTALAGNAPGDIRIEVRRGATTVTVVWPISAATQCAGWMRELLA